MSNRSQLRILVALAVLSSAFLLSLLLTPKGQAVLPTASPQAPLYYVAPDGNDSNPGTLEQPWRTLQKAANSVEVGSTVYVRGGSYPEQLVLRVSGSAAGGFITFRNYEGETPVLDGASLTLTSENGSAISIVDQSYVTIQGFEIRNYRSASRDVVPSAIMVQGSAHHIQLKDNRIHAIETTAPVDAQRQGANAHAIAVYGTTAPASIHDIVIENNELYNLKLGSSEALVLNGNVEGFTVAGNFIHDADNIGIDIIGFEGTAPDPAYDQARKGTVVDNRVQNISAFGNPAYGNVYAAGGIYVDGGREIVIERNIVSLSDIGIELASEHAGRATSQILVRNNVLLRNHMAGLSMGGYDTQRGSTEGCVIVNNTFFENDTERQGFGELGLQFDTRNNRILNNIFYANSQSLFIGNNYQENSNNTVDYNLYFAPAGAEGSAWQWKAQNYQGFAAYRAATGNDGHSRFANPQFVDASLPDIHLQPGSPAIDQGQGLPEIGTLDVDQRPRIEGPAVDIGADEYSTGLSLYLPLLLRRS